MIRDFRLPGDRAAILKFIDGSQACEAAFELNRRLDGQFGAEKDGHVIGWTCCLAQAHGVFVKEHERPSG